MKILLKSIAVCLLLACILSSTVMAVPDNETVQAVRVNGSVVEFPDGQPYVDENNRTLIPVRFVSEELGAEVEWDNNTRSAIISKDGTEVVITIGSPDLKVTENGAVETVKMDTEAVIKDSRTYVPIRFVAESLDAVVDYSDAYKTVGIYDSDVLTAEQILKLQAYEYTKSPYSRTYEEASKHYDAGDLAHYYGTIRYAESNFATAREYLYRCNKYGMHAGTFNCPTTGASMYDPDFEVFYKGLFDEISAALNYKSENVTVEFLTDYSCVYHPDASNGMACVVRGIAKVNMHNKLTELTSNERALIRNLGFNTGLLPGAVLSRDVDVHVNTMSNVTIIPGEITPLSEVY